MCEEHLSYYGTQRCFEIAEDNRLRDWKRIYLEEEPEGFWDECRGYKSAGSPKKLKKMWRKISLQRIRDFVWRLST